MSSFKRSQAKYVKKAYRVRNWPPYEQGLRGRGSLTVWLGLVDGKLNHWDASKPRRPRPGRQRKYSEQAIETAVTLGMVFGLASRQTEGFFRSLLALLELDNAVPDHTTISRRKAQLGKDYRRIHICVDEKTGEVVAAELTRKSAPDASRVKSLLSQVKRPLGSVRADGGYDAGRVYEAVGNH